MSTRRISKSQRIAKRFRKQFAVYLKKNVGVMLVLIIIGAVAFTSIKTVINIKQRPVETDEKNFTLEINGENVLGISDIPVFPGSTFMFTHAVERGVVQEFLADGKSAYTLPVYIEWDEARDFYIRELENLDWLHELSVDVSDNTMLHGEYWSQDSAGLRIYTKYNDIWYEKITLEQAKSGLQDIVSRENELEMMLAMNVGDELPENFPWSLEYSSIWAVEINKSSLLEIEKADFVNSETDGTLSIEPIGFVSMESLQQIAGQHIDEVNGHRDSEDKFDVEVSEVVEVADRESVRFDLKSATSSGALCVLSHPRTGVIYAVGTYNGELAFFNYVIDNLVVNEEED